MMLCSLYLKSFIYLFASLVSFPSFVLVMTKQSGAEYSLCGSLCAYRQTQRTGYLTQIFLIESSIRNNNIHFCKNIKQCLETINESSSTVYELLAIPKGHKSVSYYTDNFFKGPVGKQ